MDKKRIILPSIVAVLFAAITYYIMCPPINFHSGKFWVWLMMCAFFVGVSFFIFSPLEGRAVRRTKNGKIEIISPDRAKTGLCGKISGISFLVLVGLIVLNLLANVFSGRLFHAKAYSRILNVEEGSVEDIPSVDETDAIALMDTNSARSLGDRKIGTLSHVVSQYELIGYDYTQINWKNRPVKVAPLSYGGFFKWINNRGSGVPGYVAVDPVSMEAEYMELESGMHLVPSAYFGEDLNRYLRFRYPTVIYENPHFEVDEEGKPWYVAPIVQYSIFIFGGERISGVLTADPVTGETFRYALADVPDWVDLAIPGDLICRQYNDYAQLQRGYLNSIFGQVGCREVTRASITDDSDNFDADYGYIAKDNDIYIYTGITSVNGDASNIGFIMANERTGKTIFIDAPGANEFSATNAAEGEVQEKGYMASFPSLITIDDVPTYIMVLRDKSNLVKMYACVNVEQYNMVVNATKQKDCIDKYRALLRGDISQEEANDENTVVDPGQDVDLTEFEKIRVTVKRLQAIDKGGDTYLYLVDTQNRIFHAKYADVLGMLLVSEGDSIEIYVKDDMFRYEP
ncbi:MAG: hypothetical protein IJM26_03565 [Lachnospiraceae bacterium]|nr:hypothetical protein [Lachnospiraceae bacterium]